MVLIFYAAQVKSSLTNEMQLLLAQLLPRNHNKCLDRFKLKVLLRLRNYRAQKKTTNVQHNNTEQSILRDFSTINVCFIQNSNYPMFLNDGLLA